MKLCPKCGTAYPDTTTLCPVDGNALEKSDDSLLGQTLAGKYRIDERLSEGGMGAVYRGCHVLMDKTVAIKVLHPSLAADQKIVARFSREARAASRISHPHALSVTDFGEDENGVVFLVMEYLSGRTLKDVIREDGPMDLQRVVEILKQVAAALDVAHEQGVVHRDLKSDNIMLVSSSGADYAKVLDFGIAKIKEPDGQFDGGLTAPDLVIGTPQYMSPEQCSQAPDIDSRSDVYSLGVILYEMLVGHVPFTGPSPTAIMMKHLQDPVPKLSDERPDLPAHVEQIISRGMAKLPAERYQTAGELVEDLAIVAGGEPLLTTPLGKTSTGEQKRVTTGNPPVTTDDIDEETLVSPRYRPPQPVVPLDDRQTRPMTAAAPPAISTFNPWKVIIPSLVALLVVFGGIYLFTRNSESTTVAPTEPALVADPNSQPVEPAQPATGKGEQGIPSGGAATSQTVNPNPSPDASPSPDETPEEGFDPDDVEPVPNNNANTNSNRPASPLPSPPRQVNMNTQPSPAPGSESKPTPNPTLPPASPPPGTAP